jgi:hypothetical protein
MAYKKAGAMHYKRITITTKITTKQLNSSSYVPPSILNMILASIKFLFRMNALIPHLHVRATIALRALLPRTAKFLKYCSTVADIVHIPVQLVSLS